MAAVGVKAPVAGLCFIKPLGPIRLDPRHREAYGRHQPPRYRKRVHCQSPADIEMFRQVERVPITWRPDQEGPHWKRKTSRLPAHAEHIAAPRYAGRVHL